MVRLSAAKRSQLQGNFRSFDKSGDNKLNFNEMKVLLKQGNPDFAESDLKQLFASVDRNHDGNVDFDEFVAYLYQEKKEYQQAPKPVEQKFIEFAGPEMDNTEFSKFCADCGLIDSIFRKVDVDTTFAKVKPRGRRTITVQRGKDGYSDYDKLLCLIAEKKGVPLAQVYACVVGGAKCSSGTVADAVRFHDDKTLYTGAHAANEAHSVGAAKAASPKAERERFDIGREGPWDGVEATFNAFDKEGNGIDSREFAKLCTDCGLLDKKLTKGDCDVIFAKLRARRLNFPKFQESLKLVAERRKDPISDVQRRIAATEGPTVNATVADAVRFHDDKSSYTGMHAGK